MKNLTILGIAAALASAMAAHAAPIYNNGPVVDAGGLSILTPPATTFGFGNQTSSGNAVADDFTIAAGQTWNVESINFYGYQTGSTSFTFEEATWSVMSGDVNTGTVVASGVTVVTNGGLMGYRVTTTLTNTQRGIHSAAADAPIFRWVPAATGCAGA